MNSPRLEKSPRAILADPRSDQIRSARQVWRNPRAIRCAGSDLEKSARDSWRDQIHKTPAI